MAQNDTHVALIILTTQMWGGGGGLLVEKTFSGQILCSCALGANIRSYTKQGPNTEPHFSNPPPLLRRASMSPPPPPPTEQFQVALAAINCQHCINGSPSTSWFSTHKRWVIVKRCW